MIPYNDLDAETRCFTLMGQFLWHWAYMETALNEAIGTALELAGVQRYIVTKNIQFRDKTKILKACVAVSLMSDDERKQYHKTLNLIAAYSTKRNMVAHDMFGPHPVGDGVTFLRVVANDKVDFPDTPMSVADFTIAFDEMDAFRNEILKMKERLKGVQNMARIAKALLSQEAPSDNTIPLGALGRLLHQPPTHPVSSPQSIQKIDLQSQEEPPK